MKQNPKPEKAFLSKSTFIRGMQCEKSLYLHKKRPFLRDRLSPEQLAKFTRGHAVGVYARELVTGGRDLGAASPFQMAASIRKTAEAVQRGQVIYEASFQYQGVRVALDILHPGAKGWEAVEVKSSRAISDTYLWDASLQYYVIRGSGLDLNGFSIAHINPDYVRKGELDIHQLFTVVDVMEEVLRNQETVRGKVERFREVVNLSKSPDIAVGSHCINPYPCDFIGHCWKKHMPTEKEGGGRRELPDRHALEAFLKRAAGAGLCFSTLDFSPAIPLFDGTSPYQRIGFSLGWVPAADAVPEILQADAGAPFPVSWLRDMLGRLEAAGGLVVFNRARELEVMRNLCEGDVELMKRVEALGSRMYDMQELFSPSLKTPWGLSLHDSPEDVLSYLGVPWDRQRDFAAGRTDAARLLEEMAVADDPSDKEEKRKALHAFHSDAVKNLRSLYLWLKGDHC